MITYTLFFKFYGSIFRELSFNFDKIDEELVAKLNRVFDTKHKNLKFLLKYICRKFSCRVLLLYNPQLKIVYDFFPKKHTNTEYIKLIKVLQCSQS